MELMADIEELKRVVEDLHRCKASYLDNQIVIEKYKSKTVWKGIVYLFHLEGHAQTDLCYTWYSTIPETKKRRYYAVLRVPPIDSPASAVRASIIQEYKKQSE